MGNNVKSQGTTQATEKRVKELEGQLSKSQKQVEALRKELSQASKAGETVQKAYDRVCEDFNSLFKENGEMKEKHQREIEQYKEGITKAEQTAKQALTEFRGVNGVLSNTKEKLDEERLLKNEAYAFILSEGLIDKFLDFREPFHRTRSQDIHYNLTIRADFPDFWIGNNNLADYTEK